jgi:hypothetical protein
LSRGVWVVSPKLPSTSPQHLFRTYYIYLPYWLCLLCCTPWCLTTPVRGHLSVSLLPLSSPTLPLFICTPSPHLCIISRDYTQGLMTFTLIVRRLCRSRLPDVVDFPTPHLLLPQQHRTNLGRIGTDPCNAMAPSAITWITIYGRLGTRRLGTAFLCILL